MNNYELDLPEPSLGLILNHYFETMKHKFNVMRFLLRVCSELIKRGLVHDMSKFSDEESLRFSVTVPELESTTYGSDRYKELLGYLDEALEHHYENNSHHPEYWDGEVDSMPIFDVIEMLCDWKAATLRHDDGDIRESIVSNSERFGYTDADTAKFIMFLDSIDAL